MSSGLRQSSGMSNPEASRPWHAVRSGSPGRSRNGWPRGRQPGRRDENSMGSGIEIVPATQDMLSALLSLEETCFSAPWTRKMMEAELTGNQFARFLVARDAVGAIV